MVVFSGSLGETLLFSLSSFWTIEMSPLEVCSPDLPEIPFGPPSFEPNPNCGVGHPPFLVSGEVQGSLGYLNLKLDPARLLGDLGERRDEGERHSPPDPPADPGWVIGGDLSPSWSLNAKALSERVDVDSVEFV